MESTVILFQSVVSFLALFLFWNDRNETLRQHLLCCLYCTRNNCWYDANDRETEGKKFYASPALSFKFEHVALLSFVPF
jgi:hypothetical protein